MRRLLICGFGPFPQAPDNPAAETVRRLKAARWSPPGAETAYALLPTTWARAAEAALEAAKAHDADAILLIGVAVGALGFRVETRGRNQAGPARPDADGQCWPSDTIDEAGPAERRTPAPIQAMRDAIAATGLPVTLSDDAGDYLCNFAFYRVMAERPMTAFLHAPALSEVFSLDDLLTAARAAATILAAPLD
jgi:pyroglutamyl-peptidase